MVTSEVVSPAQASDLGPCEIVGIVVPEATSKGVQVLVAGRSVFHSRWALPAMYIPLEPICVERGDKIECDLSLSAVLLHISKYVDWV